MLFRLRALALVAVVPLGVAGVGHAGLGGPGAHVAISGPKVLTRASTYRVTLSGSGAAKACRVQETTTEQVLARTSATSYALPVTLTSLAGGHRMLVVQAFSCRDRQLGQATLNVYEPVHVNLASRWIAPAATDTELHQLSLSVTTVDRTPSAKIVRGGRTVTELGTGRGHTTRWTWTPPAHAAPGAYTVEVSADGHTAAFSTTITRNWAPLSPPFPRCRILTWTYSTSRQPARATGMAADVATAFQRVSRATGISFKHVSAGGTIELGWKDLGANGADGEGGATWAGDAARSGSIEFNTESRWVGLAGFGRYSGGMPGRGAMITHEIGHSLGLGHVTNPHEVMYPVAGDGSPTGLAAGDITGLKALYHPSSC